MLKMKKSHSLFHFQLIGGIFLSSLYFLEDIQQYPLFSPPPLLSCMFLFVLPSFPLHTYFDFTPSLRHLQVLWMSGGRSVGSDTAEMLMVSDYIHRSVRAAGTSPAAQSAVWVPEMEDRAHALQADNSIHNWEIKLPRGGPDTFAPLLCSFAFTVNMFVENLSSALSFFYFLFKVCSFFFSSICWLSSTWMVCVRKWTCGCV